MTNDTQSGDQVDCEAVIAATELLQTMISSTLKNHLKCRIFSNTDCDKYIMKSLETLLTSDLERLVLKGRVSTPGVLQC